MRKKVNTELKKGRKQVENLEEAFQPLLWMNRILSTAVFEMPVGQYWMKLSIFFAIGKFVMYGTITWYVLSHMPQKVVIFPILIGVYELIHYINVTISALSSVICFINYKVSHLKLYFLSRREECE